MNKMIMVTHLLHVAFVPRAGEQEDYIVDHVAISVEPGDEEGWWVGSKRRWEVGVSMATGCRRHAL